MRHGHRRLACHLIEDAMKADGYDFNTLHKEASEMLEHQY